MLTHQSLNRHKRVVPHIRILMSHQLHHPHLPSEIRYNPIADQFRSAFAPGRRPTASPYPRHT